MRARSSSARKHAHKARRVLSGVEYGVGVALAVLDLFTAPAVPVATCPKCGRERVFGPCPCEIPGAAPSEPKPLFCGSCGEQLRDLDERCGCEKRKK